MAAAENASEGMSSDAKAGLVLAAAAVLGLIAENIDAVRPFYDLILSTKLTVAIDDDGISKSLLLWINDGLMAIFFLLIALEIKREVAEGALSTWKQAALPVYAAIGGIAIPAAVFLAVVGPDSAEARGWAIPAATDIAFVLGVLGLLGRRVPAELKTFLLALAVVDDLGAIAIIAMFYTADLSPLALILSGMCLAGLLGLNLSGVRRSTPYVLLGLALWVCVLKSGVHATLAGVAIGFAIPLARDADGYSPAIAAEQGLHHWVSYLVMPLFAFANAGVPLQGLSLGSLVEPLTLAVLLGLVVGKQVGVFGGAVLAIRIGLAERPASTGYLHLYGASLLAGIGFTMSLFIGALAYSDAENQAFVRIGVMAGSLIAGIGGAAVLLLAKRRAQPA